LQTRSSAKSNFSYNIGSARRIPLQPNVACDSDKAKNRSRFENSVSAGPFSSSVRPLTGQAALSQSRISTSSLASSGMRLAPGRLQQDSSLRENMTRGRSGNVYPT
jgi:hypothetical protein